MNMDMEVLTLEITFISVQENPFMNKYKIRIVDTTC